MIQRRGGCILLWDVARGHSGGALGGDVGAGDSVIVQIERQQKLRFIAFEMQ